MFTHIMEELRWYRRDPTQLNWAIVVKYISDSLDNGLITFDQAQSLMHNLITNNNK